MLLHMAGGGGLLRQLPRRWRQEGAVFGHANFRSPPQCREHAHKRREVKREPHMAQRGWRVRDPLHLAHLLTPPPPCTRSWRRVSHQASGMAR